MTAGLTLAAYAAVVVAAVALEVAARRREAAALRIRPVRVALLAGWLWLGWHVFVRVDWQ